VTVRHKILDAVETLIGTGGFRAVSIASAAAAAGVSRQSVYSHFGTREELLAESITATSTRALTVIADQIESLTDPGAYAVELLVAARAQFRSVPALAVLLFPETGNPIFDADMFAQATPIAGLYVAPLFERAPHLAEREADVVEVLLRAGLSVLMFDSDAVRTDADLRGYLTRTMLPALGLPAAQLA
jgi:AcrR family transcriptional regulator